MDATRTGVAAMALSILQKLVLRPDLAAGVVWCGVVEPPVFFTRK